MLQRYGANNRERNIDANEFATRLRAVEDAGYVIDHYLGFLAPRDRIVARQQMAASRRQVAVKEKELYFALRSRGVWLPPQLNSDWEMLDHRQDQYLIEYLVQAGAFRSVCLNEQYRVESTGPLTGCVLLDRQIWEKFRDQNNWWDIENDWHGRWRSSNGWLFPDERKNDADILQHAGAFATPGISRYFRSERYVSDWYIYMRTMEMHLTWHSRLGVWISGDRIQFGDTELLRAP